MRHFWALFIVSCACSAFAQTGYPLSPDQSPHPREHRWVDSVFSTMSLDQKIGQLFMIRAHSDKGPEHVQSVEQQIKTYQVGGLCFFQGNILGHGRLINQYQQLSTYPLMVAMDAEWGLGMRLYKDAISFPKQMTLGAIQDKALVYEMGKEVGAQLKRLGVHVNFAPVADVNNNPHNPVINTRSFGENRYDVAEKSTAYMQGLQDAGVLACAKHFPGHGDTNVDSHYDLPTINHDLKRLDSIELFPFKALVKNGVGSVMIAHLHIPKLDSTENIPATLSSPIVDGILRDQLGFEGLVITDALEMQGVTRHFPPDKAASMALMAGSDIILLPSDIAKSIKGVKEAVQAGQLSRSDLHRKVRRVLSYKFRLGLTRRPYTRLNNLYDDLNNTDAQILKRTLYKKAFTLVQNKENLIPIWNIHHKEIATLALGSNTTTPFQRRLSGYLNTHHYSHKGEDIDTKDNLFQVLSGYETVIISLNDLNNQPRKNYGVSSNEILFVTALSKRTRVILVNFGTPYILKFFENIPWLIQAYEEDPFAQDLCAQAICGVFPFEGRLPVSPSDDLTYHMGTSTPLLLRLGHGLPFEVGMNGDTLKRIDDLMKLAIEKGATPGGQVVVAKDGRIVFNKAYGHHTYKQESAVSTTDVFDVASVTKVAATTLSLMKLVDQGVLNLEDSLGHYLVELRGSNKSGLKIKDILLHTSGLRAWIPFYENTISDNPGDPRPLLDWYANRPTTHYNVRVNDDLYLHENYVDTIWQTLIDSKLRTSTNYRYSDLGFYLFAKLVERLSGQPLDVFANEQFYKPLGLRFTGFRPTDRLLLTNIVPSEEDNYFRRSKVHGHVHDFGAAMLGGVSGHAGLFSNASELAILGQMLLNNGYYGGRKYFSNKTLSAFTQRHNNGTRRGLGFDMKELNGNRSQNMCEEASEHTFGHLGFTGTSIWIDPEHNLVFVFLSNRTYPSMHNYKLNKLNIRPRIQEVVYNSFLKR